LSAFSPVPEEAAGFSPGFATVEAASCDPDTMETQKETPDANRATGSNTAQAVLIDAVLATFPKNREPLFRFESTLHDSGRRL
jgi:hypothetical protein